MEELETEEHEVVEDKETEATDEVAHAGTVVVEPEPVEEEVCKLRVVYSKFKHNGVVYNVGDIIEMSPEECDYVLMAMADRPRKHLEYVE